MSDHEQATRLNEYLNKYIEIRKRTEEKKKELVGLQKRRDALLDLLVYLKGPNVPTREELEGESAFPLVLGKSHSKFTVTSIGILPSEECFAFYNQNYIYPPGYKIKRKYNGLTKSDPKVVYYCQIRNENGECIFEIRTINGKIWSGSREEVWRSFSSEFEKMSFTSLENFFGLTHESIQTLIESMGDVSVLSTYIPFRIRCRKGRKPQFHQDE
ncbi:hypothetical protein NEHOM01_2022 [Nematocida homosporus]|uniref:uncharacterized protein n=1 Tax=Nematocida homosporus TaxID=1912981 RepID=UPI00221FB540|nr:uncharacterized protein NEHOM01_2022 [Nematocida homosporus]KAI5187224.1 hypothetical protein NEHOM01_2022 [Nematocida homosporus]